LTAAVQKNKTQKARAKSLGLLFYSGLHKSKSNKEQTEKNLLPALPSLVKRVGRGAGAGFTVYCIIPYQDWLGLFIQANLFAYYFICSTPV